jgi:hypothetical protein
MSKKKKKKSKKQLLIDSLGKGAREQYLEENPHGYKAVTKKHKNKKKYNRKKLFKISDN